MAEGANNVALAGTGGGQPAQAPRPPTPDPRLPLTPMQVFKLKKNWKGIKRRLDDTGVEMLIRLFRLSPSIREQFDDIRDLHEEAELRMSEDLENHAIGLMTSLDDIVNNIDDVDYALDKIKKTAEELRQSQGFSADQFLLLEKPFLEAVKIILDDRYTDNMDTIYRILIKFILDHLVKAGS